MTTAGSRAQTPPTPSPAALPAPVARTPSTSGTPRRVRGGGVFWREDGGDAGWANGEGRREGGGGRAGGEEGKEGEQGEGGKGQAATAGLHGMECPA